jgi:uncharacterized protein
MLCSKAEIESKSEARFLELAFANPNNILLFERLKLFDLPNWTIVSGCLFQTVWNVLEGRDPTSGIKDYDLFYFDDMDLSWDAEDIWIKKVDALIEGSGIPVETRNQARVHLWYPDHFGVDYEPLKGRFEGIDRFLAPTCAFGLYADAKGEPKVYAPFGYDDLFAQIVRPNPAARGENHYYAKAKRWQEEWAKVSVLPWRNDQHAG